MERNRRLDSRRRGDELIRRAVRWMLVAGVGLTGVFAGLADHSFNTAAAGTVATDDPDSATAPSPEESEATDDLSTSTTSKPLASGSESSPTTVVKRSTTTTTALRSSTGSVSASHSSRRHAVSGGS